MGLPPHPGAASRNFCLTMDDGLTLFLSLPVHAQNSARRRVDRRDPDNLRTLTRVVYAWVQTLAEAQCIAAYLATETHPAVSPLAERGKFPRAESILRSAPAIQA